MQATSLDWALRRLGHDAFRPGQREAIEALLEQRRLLLVAPTGGGKSLTYQLPALLLEGTSLVISPLISLMHDQVAALTARDVPATFLASTLDPEELRRRCARLARGEYRLVYLAPERLVLGSIRSLLRSLAPPLIAIDEAHCISEWGHDFRPEYLALGELLREFDGARMLACTATATPVVRDEILARLGLPPSTPQHVRGFARPNLALRAAEVEGARDRQQRVDALLREALGAAGSARGTAIVYGTTRRSVEEEAERLRGRGWRCEPYHAGLEGERRDATQSAFQRGELEIVVATNAFGMGIDRSDVRAVIHLGPPGSIEAYYQEVGRAGRDGARAYGLLLVAPRDLVLRRHLISQSADGSAGSAALVDHKWGMFLELLRWAEGGSCRHDAILRYFDDEKELLQGCGLCDVCERLEVDPEPAELEETTLIVRKALSAVARIRGRFGIQLAARLLRGTPDPRLTDTGLDQTPTFGTLKEHSDEWLLRLLRRCVVAGWVDFEGGDRPVVVLTSAGADVMHGRRPARLVLPPRQRLAARAPRMPTDRAASSANEPLTPADAALFEALRTYRLERAREEGVPPYVVASDRTLRAIVELRPTDLDGLTLAHGIGSSKARKYGPGLLAVVAANAE